MADIANIDGQLDGQLDVQLDAMFVKEIKCQFKGIILDTASIEIMKGWFGLIREMLTEINQCSSNDKNIGIVQIKQKFAELRVYSCGRVSKEIDAIIEKYKAMALHVCEFCGKEGKEVLIGSWIFVACDDCTAKNKQDFVSENLNKKFE